LTQNKISVLQNAGMVNDSQWMDVDNCKIEDLIMAGEWDQDLIAGRFEKNNKLSAHIPFCQRFK
jgi:hypothetical protein